MRLAALFSGGKDSTYAIYLAEKLGHEVPLLLTISPATDESYYFHYPNIWITRLQAEAMEKGHIMVSAGPSRADELHALIDLIDKISGEIDGLLSGVIKSSAQYEAFKKICMEKGLRFVTPLWSRDPVELLEEMLSDNFEILIVGVAAEGLKKDLLGKVLDRQLLRLLKDLSESYGISPVGEGGEFETLVIDGPLFKKRIRILDYDIRWSGYSGFMSIKKAELVEK